MNSEQQVGADESEHAENTQPENAQTPGAESPQTDERMPSNEQLEEPSTEKEVGEEPQAARPHDPEPDHQAVGIGVVGGPQTTADEADQADG